jgi:hypothetical protein
MTVVQPDLVFLAGAGERPVRGALEMLADVDVAATGATHALTVWAAAAPPPGGVFDIVPASGIGNGPAAAAPHAGRWWVVEPPAPVPVRASSAAPAPRAAPSSLRVRRDPAAATETVMAAVGAPRVLSTDPPGAVAAAPGFTRMLVRRESEGTP